MHKVKFKYRTHKAGSSLFFFPLVDTNDSFIESFRLKASSSPIFSPVAGFVWFISLRRFYTVLSTLYYFVTVDVPWTFVHLRSGFGRIDCELCDKENGDIFEKPTCMTEPSFSLIAMDDASHEPIPITLAVEETWPAWRAQAGTYTNTWIDSVQFLPKAGETCLVPGPDGRLANVLVGAGKKPDLWSLGRLPYQLPQGVYVLDAECGNVTAMGGISLGWALGAYQFARYKAATRPPAELVVSDENALADARRLASATYLVRDLINTPASDMGPAELTAVAEEVAAAGGAVVNVILGEDLIEHGYPTIHAVGRASARMPRLIDLRWGPPKAPRVTLIGKGVCFDSGGLDIKPADNMLLMKKDMGGAAHVLALAQSAMEQELEIQLRVLIPAVENSISSRAFRPGDVIRTRAGKTVEVGNTDAEGRLILCDALAEADSEAPELMIDIATLTGAARIALGTDIAAMFTDDEGIAVELSDQAQTQQDPLWRLPMWDGYKDDLESAVADLNNVSSHRYAGAIGAALFLREFVSEEHSWVHFDIMGWNPKDRPGRLKGGEALALRALDAMLAARYRKTF